jgi:hypothetical protein
MTAAARRRIFEPTDEEKEQEPYAGIAPEVTDLLNKSRFAQLIRNTIGEFDPPTATQVGVTPANTSQNTVAKGFNLVGFPEEVRLRRNAARSLRVTDRAVRDCCPLSAPTRASHSTYAMHGQHPPTCVLLGLACLLPATNQLYLPSSC